MKTDTTIEVSETQLAVGLLEWYHRNRRDLPWRRRRDPYAIWISEVMLQQTTVAAVIPYFNRWMARFPTLTDLAEAPLDIVLQHWAGLGYYARARNLHKAAQAVVSDFGGDFPKEIGQLLSLPGVGRYTAGAVASIAFNADVPIVDANVARVLSRVYALDGDPKSTATQAELWRIAAALIPTGSASDFNQALMELGARVCDSSTPLCYSCPIADCCRAFVSGDPTTYPQIVRRDRWTIQDDVAVALTNSAGEIVLAKRPDTAGLWGGLWELPRASRSPSETLLACAERAVIEAVGERAASLRPFGSVKHVVMKRKITLHGYIGELGGTLEAVGYERVVREPAGRCRLYPMASPQTRLVAELQRRLAEPVLFD